MPSSARNSSFWRSRRRTTVSSRSRPMATASRAATSSRRSSSTRALSSGSVGGRCQVRAKPATSESTWPGVMTMRLEPGLPPPHQWNTTKRRAPMARNWTSGSRPPRTNARRHALMTVGARRRARGPLRARTEGPGTRSSAVAGGLGVLHVTPVLPWSRRVPDRRRVGALADRHRACPAAASRRSASRRRRSSAASGSRSRARSRTRARLASKSGSFQTAISSGAPIVLVQVAFATSTVLPTGGSLPSAPGLRSPPQATS